LELVLPRRRRGAQQLEVVGAGELLTQIVEPTVARFEPELVLVSAGFDAHVEDPLAGMDVTEEGFRELARRSTESGWDRLIR